MANAQDCTKHAIPGYPQHEQDDCNRKCSCEEQPPITSHSKHTALAVEECHAEETGNCGGWQENHCQACYGLHSRTVVLGISRYCHIGFAVLLGYQVENLFSMNCQSNIIIIVPSGLRDS